MNGFSTAMICHIESSTTNNYKTNVIKNKKKQRKHPVKLSNKVLKTIFEQNLMKDLITKDVKYQKKQ